MDFRIADTFTVAAVPDGAIAGILTPFDLFYGDVLVDELPLK